MSNYVNLLKQVDIFYGLTPTQLELIAQTCQEQTFEAGQMIFPEGMISSELYIILQGEVDILVNPNLISARPEETYPAATIATLSRGQCFGEIALVDQGVRSATARASQKNTRVLVIPSDKLLNLCDSYPQLGYRLMYNLAADLALKMRGASLLMREELLYAGKMSNPDR